VVAASLNNTENIRNVARAAAEAGAKGAIQTTWAGYESKESILRAGERRQITAFVLAAEYFWNGGARPLPEGLRYAADAILTRQWDDAEVISYRERRPTGPGGRGRR